MECAPVEDEEDEEDEGEETCCVGKRSDLIRVMTFFLLDMNDVDVDDDDIVDDDR